MSKPIPFSRRHRRLRFASRHLTILVGAQVGRSTRDVLIQERGREMVEGDL